MDYLIATIVFLYFFSFLFTILVFFRLFRSRMRYPPVLLSILASAGLVFLFFQTGLAYEISFQHISYYSFIIFVLYLVLMMAVRPRPARVKKPDVEDE